MISYAAWRSVLADQPLPAVAVDLDAVEHNLRVLLGSRSRPEVTLRIASKSLRHPGLMRHLLRRGEGHVAGLMTFSAYEAEALASDGFDNLLMGYPCGRLAEAAALARAAQSASVTALVDCEEHVALLADAAQRAATSLAVCIDVDLSWRPMAGRLHVGVRRSPLREVDPVRRLANTIAATKGLRLRGLLTYEAQVAGLQDRTRGSRHLDPARRLVKQRSRELACTRREQMLRALRADGHVIDLVNGGGTGSVDSTSEDPSVTEVTVGSGFVCSHLFDGYDALDLVPALFFAVGVSRRSDDGFVTCAGGGYIASGPPALDRVPMVHLPDGLRPTSVEGWGEVQTPLHGPATRTLGVGDPVICRPAKAGELAERFSHYMLLRDRAVVGREPTYRGRGWQLP